MKSRALRMAVPAYEERRATLLEVLPARLQTIARACGTAWSTQTGTPGQKMLLRDLRSVGAVADDGEEPLWRLPGQPRPVAVVEAPPPSPVALQAFPLPQVLPGMFRCVSLRATLTGAACLRRQDARGRCGPGLTFPLHRTCGPREPGDLSPCEQGKAVRIALGNPTPVDLEAAKRIPPLFVFPTPSSVLRIPSAPLAQPRPVASAILPPQPAARAGRVEDAAPRSADEGGAEAEALEEGAAAEAPEEGASDARRDEEAHAAGGGAGAPRGPEAMTTNPAPIRLVIIESPFAGDVERNTAYARAAMLDCLRRGEAPYASHLLYTQPGVLDDANPEERTLGIEAGLAWGARADATVVYRDLGVSRGMALGVARATAAGRPVEWRTLPSWAQKAAG
jgi:hypothetical protein